MIATISSRRIVALIRQLEGIDDTDAEILENIDQYAARLGQHLAEYGIRTTAVLNERAGGEIADYEIELNGLDRESFVRGLQILNPLNITVEFDDLPNLVLNRPMLACAQGNWSVIEPEFSRIHPNELLDKVERVVTKIAFSPMTPEQRLETELSFEGWCLANGLSVPGQAYNRYEQYRQAEIAAEDKRKRDEYERFWGNS